jgi:serine/alanine adding enzyme
MHVEELRNESEWEDFAKNIPEATFYHTIKWKKIIEKSFGFVPAYFTVKDQGEVAGICPGFITAPWLLRTYNSLPNSDYGGPLFNNAHLVKGRTCLRDFLAEYCSENQISHAKLCFLGDVPKQFSDVPFTYTDRSKGIVEIDLKATPSEFIWTNLLSKKIRQITRHFEKDSFRLEEIRSKSGLKEFYSLYDTNMRHIHAPAYSYSHFENMWNMLPSQEFRVWLIRGNQNIGGSACFVHGERLYLVYAGINRKLDLRRYNVMPYLCWNLIRWAEEHGLRYVSMGSTPSDPTNTYHHLKMRFGAKFLQQDTALVPFDYSARTLLTVRSKAVSGWKAVRGLLPSNFRILLEHRLYQL